MEVVGRHALLFDDDAMAAFVNSGDALVEWHSLQIDRYDVRHLLSAPPPPRRRNRSYEPRTSDDPSMEFLIDQERYLDLPLESDQPVCLDSKLDATMIFFRGVGYAHCQANVSSGISYKTELEEEEEKPSNSGGYHAIAFTYGNTGDSADQKDTNVEMEARGYVPPFSVPGDTVQSLPPTEKVHQIIARTAIFVSKHGGQTEIILRVKQGDNPTFGFLMPDHHLHAYFRYLVEHPELLHPEIDEKSQDERKTVGTEHMDSSNTGGALSLLGSVYGSGEDEDGDDAVNASPSHDAKNMESVETAAKDESISGKSILSKKDKVPAVKKNASVIGSKHKSVKGTKKEDNFGLFSTKEEKLRNHGIGATSKPIVEPPPELKRMVDKLVEFVLRNGRQFEATLLEQDSKLERFPFLLSSNQYNPYYLKALEAAEESKVNGKNFYPGREDLGGRGISRKASMLKENDISHSSSELCDVPFESDRKEKFKMVIGKSKKEAQETEKESQECGFTVDAAAAAAILQAATKGIKSSGSRYITNTASNSHNDAVNNEDRQPANAGEKSDQSESCNLSAMLPKTIAGTASHEVAGGDDSSKANLTEEQKLKAERLKRAKMFVAMLKSGALPSRTGTSRGSSAEPVEPGVLKSATKASSASQAREGSLAPAVVNKSAVEVNFGERQHERQSKRKYRSKSIGSEDDEGDSGSGHLTRKRRSRSSRPEDDEYDHAEKKEHRYYREKGRQRPHSPDEKKNAGESSEEDKDHKHAKSLLSSHQQGDDDESEGKCNEEREAKDNEHRSERKYRSRSRSHKENDEVGKDRKHRRRNRRSHSSEESENGEDSDGQDAEHKHYKSKHRSCRSQHDDDEHIGTFKEEGDKEHQRSHGSRSTRYEGNSKTKNAVEKEDKNYRRKHSSHFSYEENGGESTGDEMEHRHKSSHSKHKNNGCEDIYKEEKDRKRLRKSRRSRHSSSESPSRHSSERRKKQRSSHASSHFSYEENGGESTGDEMEHRHKSSHSKHKNNGCEDIYKEEKDRKRLSRSRHSSSESPSRHSSERRKKQRSSHASHHSRDKHRHRHKKDRESRRRHKHDSSSDDEHKRHASSGQPGKESHDVRDDLEEGEISSKDESKAIIGGDGKKGASIEGKRGTCVDAMSPEQRAPSLPSETTEIPADLRAKIRAMLMATRS